MINSLPLPFSLHQRKEMPLASQGKSFIPMEAPVLYFSRSDGNKLSVGLSANMGITNKHIKLNMKILLNTDILPPFFSIRPNNF